MKSTEPAPVRLPGVASPQRIQLKRTKGWRKPDGAVVVTRPSVLGNPFKVVRYPGAVEPWHVWKESSR